MSENDNNSPSDGSNTQPTNNSDVKDSKGSKTFSQEELGAKLSEERKKWQEKSEKDIEERIAKERAKWDAEAKMTEDQKAAAAQKERSEALERREREVTLRERKAEATETLAEKGISPKLVDFVVDVDADKTAKNIDILAEAFNKAVEDGVKAKLAGTTPKDRGTSTTAGNGKKSSNSGIYSGNGTTAF